MTSDHPNDERLADRFDADLGRRTFIAAGGTVGAAMLAGCASEENATGEGNGSAEETEDSWNDGSNFRLLISDRPADIDDFDRLDVSFDSARIFDGGGEESDDEGGDDGGGEADANEDEPENDDGDESDGGDESDDGDESDGEDGVERRRDFYRVDLEGATVDLTQVVGDRAVSVFEGGLSPGTYEKIELHVSDVEGIVDGEVADVKVPSEKLQIVHSFEVTEDEPVEFVFDINVVQKGNGLDYNLKPVISESGVAGEDVDVERVDEDDEDEGEGEDDSDDAAGEGEDDDSDDADEGGNDEASGDEADGDEASGDESGSNP